METDLTRYCKCTSLGKNYNLTSLDNYYKYTSLDVSLMNDWLINQVTY